VGRAEDRQRVHARDTKKQRLDPARCRPRCRQSDRDAHKHQADRALQYQRDDILSRRAERHSDADFLDALGDAICQQAIESNAGQQQREYAETARERRQHPLLHDGACHLR